MIRLRYLLPNLALLPVFAAAGTSASYSLEPVAIDGGGSAAGSTSYSLVSSMMPGGVGSSSVYTSRSGFAGQINDDAGLEIFVDPMSVPELGSGQLSAELVDGDGVRTPIDAAQVSWMIDSGPVTAIDPAGLLSAGPVFEDTSAKVTGSFGGSTGAIVFIVADTVADNFEPYDGDGLSDGWQIENFGLSGVNTGPGDDPDLDGLTNRVEFAFLLDPNMADGGIPVVGDFGGVKKCVLYPLREDLDGLTVSFEVSDGLEPGSWIRDDLVTEEFARPSDGVILFRTVATGQHTGKERLFFRLVIGEN